MTKVTVKHQTKIIETNVAIVANNRKGESDQASVKCKIACIDFLGKIVDEMKQGVKWAIALDESDEILNEYKGYLSPKGQPGVGDAFLYEIFQRKYTESVRISSITKTDNGKGYLEFPDTPDLRSFDRSDRKFVALAISCDKDPIIINAVDSDWDEYKIPLNAEGVKVRQLCPDCIRKSL
jgi:hypothetical protein